MFDPLHADKQNWWMVITHAEYLYRDSDMVLCIYQYRWFIVQLMGIHIDISVYWYVPTSLTSTLQKLKLAVLDWTLAAVQLVSTSTVVYNLPVWSLSCLCQWPIVVERGDLFRLLSSHNLAFQSPDSIILSIPLLMMMKYEPCCKVRLLVSILHSSVYREGTQAQLTWELPSL